MTRVIEVFNEVNSEIAVEDIACPAVCGDNVREDSEQCDGTDTAEGLTCNATCKVVCQENHYFDTDQNKCLPNPVCGNNVKEKGEECDGGLDCSDDCKTKCDEGKIWNNEDKKCIEEPLENQLDPNKDLDVVSTKNSYTSAENPTFKVKAVGYDEYYIHLSNDNTAFGDATKMANAQIYWEQKRSTTDPMTFTISDLVLWSGASGKKTIYYRIEGGKAGVFGNLTDIKRFEIGARCPTGYFSKDGYCVKDFLGGSIHPIAMDSGCGYAGKLYSGPEGHDDYGDRSPDYPYHKGADIRASGGTCKVNAVAIGTAQKPSKDVYGANWIDIKHSDTYTTRYVHGADQFLKEGQSVTFSDYVFTMGCTGLCDGRHLHFELFVNGSQQDPQSKGYFGYLGGEVYDLTYGYNYLPYSLTKEETFYYITKRY